MRLARLIIPAFVFLLAGCAALDVPELTPLEIQSMQTREYEEGKDIVFPSMISVFQYLGYILKSADKDSGLITAESATRTDEATKALFGYSDVSQTSATAFVEQIGKMTRLRLNFVTSSNKSYQNGQTDRQDTPILDAAIYSNAFERIENAIFVRSAN